MHRYIRLSEILRTSKKEIQWGVWGLFSEVEAFGELKVWQTKITERQGIVS